MYDMILFAVSLFGLAVGVALGFIIYQAPGVVGMIATIVAVAFLVVIITCMIDVLEE